MVGMIIWLKNGLYKGLRFSERYTKTDMVYLARGGFWLGGGQILGALTAFGLSLAFANLLVPESYGTYKYILSLAGIIGSLTLTGMGTAVIQGVAAGEESILKAAFKKSLYFSFIPILVALAIAVYYWYQDNNLLAISLVVVGLALPASNAFGLYSSFLNGKRNFRLSTIYWFITYLATSLLLIGAMLVTDQPLVLIIIYFAANLIFNIVFYWHIKPTPTNIALLEKYSSKTLSYGQHLTMMNIIGTVANQLDKIIIFQLFGALPLAVYSFAQAIPEQIKGSFKNLFNLALPKYAASNPNALKASIIDKMLRLTIIAAGIALFYIIFSPLIFKLLFPKYLESVFYSQLYMIGLIALPGIALSSTYFQVLKNTKSLYIITIAGNLITLILTVILVSQYGILGAVIENSLSWFIILAVNLYFFATDKPSHEKALGSEAHPN